MSGAGTFTQAATSKLLACPTLVTKPPRAPKPPPPRGPEHGPSGASNPVRVQSRRSVRVFIPAGESRQAVATCAVRVGGCVYSAGC